MLNVTHAALIAIKYCLRQSGKKRTEPELVKRADVVVCPRGAQQELGFPRNLSFFLPVLHFLSPHAACPPLELVLAVLLTHRALHICFRKAEKKDGGGVPFTGRNISA